MDLLGIAEARFFAFVLVLLRMGALFTFAPVFSTPFVPVQVKAAAALGLSLALTVLGVPGDVPVPGSPALVALLAAQELLLGFMLGYVARLAFVAVQFGGQVVGFDMGLGIVSVIDPQFETQISVVSQFQYMLAVLLFLAVGGERMLVEVFAGNLRQLPPGQLAVPGPALQVLVRVTGEVFRVGLQVAAPVIAALFASNVILGIFARSVPQMNMLILGFPLKIMVGFLVLGISLPRWASVVLEALSRVFEMLRAFPQLLR